MVVVVVSALSVLSLVVLFFTPFRFTRGDTANTKQWAYLLPILVLVALPLVGSWLLHSYTGIFAVAACTLLVAIWGCCAPIRLAVRYTRELKTDEKHTRGALTHAVDRFLPTSTLPLIQKRDLNDIQAGDSIYLKLSILALDSFNTLDSNATGNFKDIHESVNFYDHLFRANNVLFSHFSTECAWALFNKDNSEPIEVALHIQRHLHSVQEERAPTTPLQYCAIVKGSVALGFVSYNGTLQPLASSPTVSTAMQLQRVAHTIKTPVLITQDFLDENLAHKHYHTRTIGPLYHKGSTRAMHVYEILDGYPPHRLNTLLTTREIFEEACRARDEGNTEAAYSKFSYVLATDPLDAPAQYFLEVTRKKILA